MDYLYAFLGGVLCKVYDDMHDNDMIGRHLQEILKGSQWILLAILCHADFNFASIILILNGLNAVNNWDEWNFPYETALLVLAPIFLLISFHSVRYFSGYDWLYLIIFTIFMALEPLFIKEEFSYRKLLIRSGLSMGTLTGIYVASYFDISPSILKFSYYCLGYALFSSCFQAYLLTRSPV